PGIEVIGPDYVRIGVEATVAFTSADQRKVAEGRIIDNLKQFFHPLYGGDGNTGWDLGQNLYVSEIYAVIKNTPGVDYVSAIAVKSSVQCFTVSLEPLETGPYKPLAAYPKYSAVRSDDNSIQFALAERVEAGSGVKSLVLKGFKENGIIRLRYRTYEPVKLIVVSIDGDILECQTLDGQPLGQAYPEGSDLEFDITDDLTVRTYILNGLAPGTASFFVKIAMFEPKDIVFLSRTDEYVNTTPLRIHRINTENIFLEEDELIYGGTHLVNKPVEHIFPYLLDKKTGLLHDLSGTTADCRLEAILKEDRKVLTELTAAPETAEEEPMPLPVPNLDDLGFDELVADAKTLIPLYDPDWTNYNPSDPGITLVELFAWFSEMVLYRIDQVTEESQLQFLKLLGVTPAGEEELTSGIRRGAKQFSECYRAVTAADFQFLAKQGLLEIQGIPDKYPDLAVRTLCLVNTDMENGTGVNKEAFGHVSVILILQTENQKDLLREITEIKESVKAYLDARKLLTTRVHVVEPDYRDVVIEMTVSAKDKSIGNTVIDSIMRFLDPVSGGEEGQGWAPGRKLYASDLYHLVEGIAGIDHVSGVTLDSPDLLPFQLFKLKDLKVEVEA
ncbi:hypothetical protein KC345_g11272, partial [Hortaea werneckii]